VHQAELFLCFALNNHCLWGCLFTAVQGRARCPKVLCKQDVANTQERLKMHMALGQQIAVPLLGHITLASREPNVQSSVHILEHMLGFRTDNDFTKTPKSL